MVNAADDEMMRTMLRRMHSTYLIVIIRMMKQRNDMMKLNKYGFCFLNE